MVFDVHSQFGKGGVVAVGLEDGVVAESLAAVPLARDLSGDNAFKLVAGSLLSPLGELEGAFL